MRRRALLAACLAAALAAPAGAGDVGPIVVYLEGGPSGAATAAPPVEIRQRSARFSPPFVAVARGQAVEMPNDDDIYHNVFSFSAPNDFDLGLYPGGESREVAFQHPGVVRIFCSIHEAMTGTLFVAPTPWFAVVEPDGRFAIRGAPAGRFRLRTWAAKLPPTEQELTLGPRTTSITVRLGNGDGVQLTN